MHDAAIDALRKAVQLQPDHGKASKLMAWLLLQQAEQLQREAKAAAERAVLIGERRICTAANCLALFGY